MDGRTLAADRPSVFLWPGAQPARQPARKPFVSGTRPLLKRLDGGRKALSAAAAARRRFFAAKYGSFPARRRPQALGAVRAFHVRRLARTLILRGIR